jgi:hypothetical protein
MQDVTDVAVRIAEEEGLEAALAVLGRAAAAAVRAAGRREAEAGGAEVLAAAVVALVAPAVEEASRILAGGPGGPRVARLARRVADALEEAIVLGMPPLEVFEALGHAAAAAAANVEGSPSGRAALAWVLLEGPLRALARRAEHSGRLH